MSVADGPTVVIRMNRIPELGVKFSEAVRAVLGKGAFDCEARIKGFMQAKGVIDTGALMNAWETAESSGGGRIEFRNSNALEYGIFQNYGTRYIAARPFVEPAFDATAPGVIAAMRAIGSRL